MYTASIPNLHNHVVGSSSTISVNAVHRGIYRFANSVSSKHATKMDNIIMVAPTNQELNTYTIGA